MITDYEIEYMSESGHPYGTYVCPYCKEKFKSRLSLSYISKIESCKKCSIPKKMEKFALENKFGNGKKIEKFCRDCSAKLDEKNRARHTKSKKIWCICKNCYSIKRKISRSTPEAKIKEKAYNLKSREVRWNHYLFKLVKRRYPQTDLSPEYIKELWDKQNGLCFWFKVPMTITSKRKFPSKPSIDRIDNSKPYTKDNCVLCCYSANIGRNENNVDDWTQFLNLIREQIIKEQTNERI